MKRKQSPKSYFLRLWERCNILTCGSPSILRDKKTIPVPSYIPLCHRTLTVSNRLLGEEKKRSPILIRTIETNFQHSGVEGKGLFLKLRALWLSPPTGCQRINRSCLGGHFRKRNACVMAQSCNIVKCMMKKLTFPSSTYPHARLKAEESWLTGRDASGSISSKGEPPGTLDKIQTWPVPAWR